eukprot:SAG31_NODE_6857_length_1868_cov_4.094969_1_plen_312_part_01
MRDCDTAMVYESQNAPLLPVGATNTIRRRQCRRTAQAAVGAAALVATAVVLLAGSAQLQGAGTAVNKQSGMTLSPDTTKALIGTLFGNMSQQGPSQPQADVTVDRTDKGFIGTSLASGAPEDAETAGNESVVSNNVPSVSEMIASASVEASPAAPVLALAANGSMAAPMANDLLAAAAQSAKPALALSEKAFFGMSSTPVPTAQAVASPAPSPQTSAKQTQAPAPPVPASEASSGNATASAFDRSKVTPEMVAKKQEMDQLAASILAMTPHSQEYTAAREKLRDAKMQLGQMKEARKSQLEKVNADRTAALA